MGYNVILNELTNTFHISLENAKKALKDCMNSENRHAQVNGYVSIQGNLFNDSFSLKTF